MRENGVRGTYDTRYMVMCKLIINEKQNICDGVQLNYAVLSYCQSTEVSQQ